MNKSKLIKYIKNAADWLYTNRCVLVLSVAIGGFLSLYVISLCRTYIIFNLDEGVSLYDYLIEITESNSLQAVEITDSELDILIISVGALMFVPLTLKCRKKIRFALFGLNCIFLFDFGVFLLMFASQRIDNIFVSVVTLSCIYLVWVCLEILKVIYLWLRNLIRRKTK